MPSTEPGPVGSTAAADLAVDTAVRKEAVPGLYTAHLPESWNYITPSGGVLMTVALRAIRAELADIALRPVSATALFCSRVAAGPLEIRVEVLRRGRSASQIRAVLSAPGTQGPGLEVSATFARERPGPDVIDTEMPKVPRPEDVPLLDDLDGHGRRARLPFNANFDACIAIGHPFWKPGWEPGRAEFARWFRYKRPQRIDGLLDPLAIPPIADTMPPAVTMKLGPKHPRFVAPSLDLTIHFLDDTGADWLLVSSRSRRARAGYATADTEVWSSDGRLVAYAAQTMLLTGLTPE